jgi:hydrogenase maturation protease
MPLDGQDCIRHETVKVLVLGIGNPVRTDDGVGIRIAEALKQETVGSTVDIKNGISGLDILGAITDYDRIIVVDAIRTGGEPGTIYRLSPEDPGFQKSLHAFSTHDMDFLSTIELGKSIFAGRMPKDIIIIAVEADDITTVSDRCTPRVEKAVPKAVHVIKGLL